MLHSNKGTSMARGMFMGSQSPRVNQGSSLMVGGDASGAQVGSPEPTKVLLPGFRALKVLTAEESSG